MIRQYELVDMVRAYDPNVDEGLLNRAYVFSMKVHGSQTRHSGDPYFSHPLEVAGILTGLKLDSATIATGLLHDTVEDTAASLEEITDLFGDEVAVMVDGVTKLSLIELSSEETKQAENFRKFMIAMSRDIRVLLVKLADRLHNMRTLYHHPKEASRRRIAQETMDLYAPLAGRIGMQDVRDELEDLAFEHLFPEARESILSRLSYVAGESGQLIEEIRGVVGGALQKGGLDAVVSGRQKRPYSTWRKLQTKEISFEQLSDIIGFRVILDDVEACYRALGVLHQKWKTVPGHFKDYISTPKSNGYQSIHTTIIGPKQQRVELQIRTEAMHEIAEYGVAAHWLHKESQSDLELNDDVALKPKANPYEALSRFVELLEDSDNPEEFLEHTKLEMFLDQVFCFTPNGDLIGLPVGATAIDFAYAVHTDVGDTCVGAKVNGLNVSLYDELQNGDSVEILRSDAQSPDPLWAGIAVTGKARSAVRRFVRDAQRSEFVRLGRDLTVQTFDREGQEFTDKGLEYAAKRLRIDDPEEILVQVGNGTLTGYDVLTAVFPGQSVKARRARRSFRLLNRNREASPTVPIHGLKKGLAVHLSRCCHPIPGDRIVGIREPGKGVNVHTIDCAKLASHTDTQDDWIDLSWDQDASERMRTVGRIRAFLQHETGSLGILCTRIGDFDGNITNIKIQERKSDVHEVVVDIEVDDLQHLTHIIAALRANPKVQSVRRVRGGLGDGIMR